MKNILTLFLFLNFLIIAEPIQLKNFEEVYNAASNGNDVNIVIHYAKTDLIIDGRSEEAPDAIGGMNLDTYEYFAIGTVRNEKAYISTSETVLINHPFYGYVYNYVKLRIYEDNKAEIVAQYLEPNTYDVKMDETFWGEISDTENDGGVYFYVD